MDNLENESIKSLQEAINRETYLEQVSLHPEMSKPSLVKRCISFLGDSLIRLGTWLKESTFTRLTADEASDPTFLIML